MSPHSVVLSFKGLCFSVMEKTSFKELLPYMDIVAIFGD